MEPVTDLRVEPGKYFGGPDLGEEPGIFGRVGSRGKHGRILE